MRFRQRGALLQAAVLALAIPTWPKTKQPDVASLARRCNSGKQDACHELESLAVGTRIGIFGV